MRTVYKWLAALVALVVFFAGVLAYFVRRVDVEQQIIYDGFGRALSSPPAWARLFTEQPAWAGLGWFAIDFVVFFGGLCVAFWFYGRGQKLPSRPAEQPSRSSPLQSGQLEMLSEITDLMGSEAYAAMSEADRKQAVTSIRRRHGFPDNFDTR